MRVASFMVSFPKMLDGFNARAGWLLIGSACPRVQFTSPWRGEVDLLPAMRSIVRRKSGEGRCFTRDRNPSPQPSPNGRGSAPPLPRQVDMISSCSSGQSPSTGGPHSFAKRKRTLGLKVEVSAGQFDIRIPCVRFLANESRRFEGFRPGFSHA